MTNIIGKNPNVDYLVIDKNSQIKANKGFLDKLNKQHIYLLEYYQPCFGRKHADATILGYFSVKTISSKQGYWNFDPQYYLHVKATIVHTIKIILCNDTEKYINLKQIQSFDD